MAQATRLSPQALTNTAKALILAYNDKNWEQAKASITPDFVYDEVATGRKVTGIDDLERHPPGAAPDTEWTHRRDRQAHRGSGLRNR